MVIKSVLAGTAWLLLAVIQSSCFSSEKVASSGEQQAEVRSSRVAVVPESAATEAFDWPVDRARLTRGFDIKRRRPHLGIDLAGPRKTPVYASHNGMVIYAGRDFRGFGKMILIETGTGWATLYAHLDAILVSEGQKVVRGSTVALLGNTGRSTGPHLHFELRRDKVPVDPLLYLPGGTEAQRKLASKKE